MIVPQNTLRTTPNDQRIIVLLNSPHLAYFITRFCVPLLFEQKLRHFVVVAVSCSLYRPQTLDKMAQLHDAVKYLGILTIGL